jgi:membrane protein
MFESAWLLLKDGITGFIDDNALSRGAAMAFFAVTSMAPILLIVVAIAGLAFGEAAAQNAIVEELTSLVGRQSAEVLQAAIKGASDKNSGMLASAVGAATLLISASGVFGEMQSALNAIWKVQPTGMTFLSFVRARAVSLGLVAALGLLLMVSLAVSAGVTALGNVIDTWLPFGACIFSVVNAVISFLLIAILFAAIFKVLPDLPLKWPDVLVGAIISAVLFTVGKFMIGIYLGSTAVASTYGAAGALLVVLLWVYYSSEVFLLGAELTRAYSLRHGSQRPDRRPSDPAGSLQNLLADRFRGRNQSASARSSPPDPEQHSPPIGG